MIGATKTFIVLVVVRETGQKICVGCLRRRRNSDSFSKIVCLGTNKIAFSKSLRQFLPSCVTSCQAPGFYLGTLESQPSVCLTTSGSCHHRGEHVPFRVHVSNSNEHVGYKREHRLARELSPYSEGGSISTADLLVLTG